MTAMVLSIQTMAFRLYGDMNERIQELAEQANAWYPAGYPSAEGGDEAWQNLVIFEKEDLEKFALLIVRKCVSTLHAMHLWQSVNKQNYPSSWHDAVDQSIDAIKEHFGITE